MFSKRINIILITLILLIGLITYFESSAPEKINWFPSYAKTDKIPLGTYISYQLISNSFSKEGISDVNLPPYEFLMKRDSIAGTYMFVNNSIYFDDSELDKILDWTNKGNTLFISAKSISTNLLDTLQLDMDNLLSLNSFDTKASVALTNKKLKGDLSYIYDRDSKNIFFNKIDTLTIRGLGTVQLLNDTLKVKKQHINYLEKAFGKGKILLHTFPEAFSNYFMLKNNNYKYTQNLLSYFGSDRPILWDNYYKTGKTFYTSPLFFLLKNRHLKWAYYFILLGVILFVIFEGKRKQRSIPIIEPLKNQTLAFTRTISGMYYEKSRHKEIATKQYILFLEYIRSTLRIPTDHITQKTLIDIAARSNNSMEETKRLFAYFDNLNSKNHIEKEELKRLYELISEFKSRT